MLAAVHHAADAVSRIVPQDRAAVQLAAAEQRLHVRTRLLLASPYVAYHYAPIPPYLLDKLLIPYDTAIDGTPPRHHGAGQPRHRHRQSHQGPRDRPAE